MESSPQPPTYSGRNPRPPRGYTSPAQCIKEIQNALKIGVGIGLCAGLTISLLEGGRGMVLIKSFGFNTLKYGGALAGILSVGAVLHCDDHNIFDSDLNNKKNYLGFSSHLPSNISY